MLWAAILGPKKTDEELVADRAAAIKKQRCEPDIVFTCDECGARWTCEYVFDSYNTHNDCLAEK